MRTHPITPPTHNTLAPDHNQIWFRSRSRGTTPLGTLSLRPRTSGGVRGRWGFVRGLWDADPVSASVSERERFRRWREAGRGER